MSDVQEMRDLMDLVFEKTLEKRLSWIMTGSNLISTRLGKSIIEIMEVNPNLHYNLVVRNENGIILSQLMFSTNEKITNLFNGVKRSALGVDEALQDLKYRLKAL